MLRKVIRRVLGERKFLEYFGNFREKELAGLISRPNYAYGLLRAADTALYFQKKKVTVCEFGVATGMGLLNLVSLANQISNETGIEFTIFGFDTGSGLPNVMGYKDHPELWIPGDFSMGDATNLRNRLPSNAKLIIGDIAQTIGDFTDNLSEDAPLGFVSIDVDIYSGSVSALQALQGNTEKYLPAISFYFDDVASFFSNLAAGELLAIKEHNDRNPLRIIDIDRSLPGRRSDINRNWHKHMYVAHILDHPDRNKPDARRPLGLMEHLSHVGALN
jgi:hypothetical protein